MDSQLLLQTAICISRKLHAVRNELTEFARPWKRAQQSVAGTQSRTSHCSAVSSTP